MEHTLPYCETFIRYQKTMTLTMTLKPLADVMFPHANSSSLRLTRFLRLDWPLSPRTSDDLLFKTNVSL